MKILSKNAGYLSYIERYDLCDVFAESGTVKGLIICYLLFVICLQRLRTCFFGLTGKAWRNRGRCTMA